MPTSNDSYEEWLQKKDPHDTSCAENTEKNSKDRTSTQYYSDKPSLTQKTLEKLTYRNSLQSSGEKETQASTKQPTNQQATSHATPSKNNTENKTKNTTSESTSKLEKLLKYVLNSLK